MAKQTKAEAEIDRLYGLPLDEFTAARNEAAKELRKGDREAADRVKALRKPTAPAWALNQAARERPRELRAFLDAARELGEAQQALLEGGDRDALQQATGRERAAAGTLADAAQELAGGGGASLRGRIDSTLRAALTDDEVRSQLEAGRLIEDHEASGFGALAAAAPAKRRGSGGKAAGGARSKAAGGAAAKSRGAREEKRKQKLRAELKAAEDAQRRAARRVRDAAAAAEEAAAEVERLRRELD